MLEIAVLVIYIACILFIFLFCMTEVALLILSYRKKNNGLPVSGNTLKEFPFVTVQLPVYNERYVIERLLDAVCSFDYPMQHFEIQVLDDSTDETASLIAQKVQHYKEKGIAIYHLQREGKTGFKAGALQYGLKSAYGEFIAIFDADFVPPPDFLKKTIPLFTEAKIGLIQAKWQHLNKDYSLLTRVQAFMLDAHFNVEQNGRCAAGVFINFNGTAGVWRKNCIEESGGWTSDTLSEDLDLSYRAQMRGWRLLYNGEVSAPAELPAAMSAIKSQQFRWSKGPAQVCRKILPAILFSDASLKVKWFALFHLMSSSIHIFVLLTALLSVPLLIFRQTTEYRWAFTIIYFFYSATAFVALVYIFSQTLEQRSLRKGVEGFVLYYFAFLSFTMGLSLQNGIAAIRGMAGSVSPFVRTPKHNIVKGSDSWKSKQYQLPDVTLLTFFEVLLAAYFVTGIYISIQYGQYQMIFFHLLLCAGYLGVSFYSIKQALVDHKAR